MEKMEYFLETYWIHDEWVVLGSLKLDQEKEFEVGSWFGLLCCKIRGEDEIVMPFSTVHRVFIRKVLLWSV